jgi:hypothetical protein
VVVIDKQFSCLQLIELFMANNYENIVVWDETKSDFEAVLSSREIISIILKLFYNVINQKSNADRIYIDSL